MSSPESTVETEIKLAVDDIEAVHERIRRAGLQIARTRVLEVNVVYDTPEGSYRAQGRLLRLRCAGSENRLTFKGPSLSTGPHKVREELEMGVSDFPTAEMILRRLGFQPSFRYEKHRTEFHVADSPGLVMLDETPIGTYLELEGHPDWIDRTALALGYSPADYITDSYASLYVKYCRERDLVPTNMVFRQ